MLSPHCHSYLFHSNPHQWSRDSWRPSEYWQLRVYLGGWRRLRSLAAAASAAWSKSNGVTQIAADMLLRRYVFTTRWLDELYILLMYWERCMPWVNSSVKSRKYCIVVFLHLFHTSFHFQKKKVADAHSEPNKWIAYFTSADNRHALPLFTSLINVVCSYDPVGYGVPYNHLLFTDHREPLVEIALQVSGFEWRLNLPLYAPFGWYFHCLTLCTGQVVER